MVRTKVEIKRIEDKAKRHTTFTKRRQGLFKKASELCKRCNAEAAVITFSLAGNAFAFGHPSVNAVLARYDSYDANRGSVDDDDAEARKVPEDAVVVASNEGLNDEDDDMKVEEMSMEELEKLDSAMEEMKRKVIARVNEIISLTG
ncbi:agamous-like MADS-box protein AGL61 [Ipomoea triloba]|uniref:agamous-like MADS-box protein AGL61 n=1 Tax=Ipomoea triloba TaxID=35885 RepID=UPI00125E9BBA|nr:agamous-like MADS-box protein AGL61 [Ipomoea triloba]